MIWWLPWHPDWLINVAALLLAAVFDAMFPEPPNTIHPVVWMGKAISALERLGDGLGAAGAFTLGAFIAIGVPALFGGAAWLAVIALYALGDIPFLIGGAALLKTAFSVRGLAQAAREVQHSIEYDDVLMARHSLRGLVSRDVTELSEPLVAAAAIESVAENTTDSFIAPWIAFALLGLPGAFAYRAVNTLDSMIGYRGRYEYLGKASARLDDAMNLIPARVSAAMMLAAGALCRLPAGRGWRWALTGRRLTASPNAGWTIGAMSGLLGVALEKSGHYRIGEGLGEPAPRHIGASIRVAYAVAAVGIPVAVGVLALRGLATG
jgi:adenosylcobinamide-phosphate synthase